MDDINWDLLKFKFEILGASKEELAEEYHIGTSLMEFNSQNWTQLPLAQREALEVTDLSSLESISDEMIQQVQSETRIASILKQRFLGPKYVALEGILLTKTISLAESLDPTERASAGALKTLSAVLKELLEQNSILNAATEKDELEDSRTPKRWEISIVDASTDKSAEEDDPGTDTPRS